MARSQVDSELVARMSLAITRVARLLRQQERARSSPAAASALAIIVRDGPITLTELAEAEQVSRSTITKIVNKLEDQGIIDRLPDADDGRISRVRLSSGGRRRIDAYYSKRNAWLADKLDSLDADDLACIIRSVAIMEKLTVAEPA